MVNIKKNNVGKLVKCNHFIGLIIDEINYYNEDSRVNVHWFNTLYDYNKKYQWYLLKTLELI